QTVRRLELGGDSGSGNRTTTIGRRWLASTSMVDGVVSGLAVPASVANAGPSVTVLVMIPGGVSGADWLELATGGMAVPMRFPVVGGVVVGQVSWPGGDYGPIPLSIECPGDTGTTGVEVLAWS